MSTLTIEKLGESVGAEVHGVTHDRLLDDEAFPAWCLEALDENGAIVFRGLHLDDETQIAFSRRLGTVEVPPMGSGSLPEIYLVTRDETKTPLAGYTEGTFNWHIDGCTDDVPIMATILSAHEVALLDGLLERATRPDRVYRHEWQVGDVVMWDNRGVLHHALPYDPTSPRDMHRTTIAGDEAIQ